MEILYALQDLASVSLRDQAVTEENCVETLYGEGLFTAIGTRAQQVAYMVLCLANVNPTYAMDFRHWAGCQPTYQAMQPQRSRRYYEAVSDVNPDMQEFFR